jgi:hypothetical protein
MTAVADMHARRATQIVAGDRVRLGFRVYHVQGNRRVGPRQALTMLPIDQGVVQLREETRLFDADETVFRITTLPAPSCSEPS